MRNGDDYYETDMQRLRTCFKTALDCQIFSSDNPLFRSLKVLISFGILGLSLYNGSVIIGFARHDGYKLEGKLIAVGSLF